MKTFLFFFLLVLVFTFRFLFFQNDLIDGSRIKIKDARISSEPLRFERSQRILILGLKAYLPLYPEINYGDKVTLEGRVNLKKRALEEVNLIEVKEAESFYRVRERILSFYRKSLPEPHSNLVSGVVLGSKSNFLAFFWEKLKKTGTAHVVVASGMNVSLVAGFLASFFLIFLKRRYALLFSLLGVWIYTFFVGFEAPIIRAAIMGSISFLSTILGKMNWSLRALFLSFLLMIIFNPYFLFDIGFILSFSATLSLILFSRKVDNFLSFIPSFFREGFATSIAAQVLVSPILYFTFGYISLYSPLVNGLVLWTIPYITVLGILAGVFSFVFPFLAKIFLFLSYPLTFWFIGTVNLFSSL